LISLTASLVLQNMAERLASHSCNMGGRCKLPLENANFNISLTVQTNLVNCERNEIDETILYSFAYCAHQVVCCLQPG
ncbi:hypothetical protein, partial [Acinetobacter baumannii]|uniref:hypothetical protein n=1 Tax=Acinetobacter baumannii TaxID=470 RepID=UPI001C0797F2